MDINELLPWETVKVGAVAGIGAFCGALLRGWGQRLATSGLARQLEEIKQEVQRRNARSDRLLFLIENLNERLDEARDNMVRFYENRPVAPGYIVDNETVGLTDVARSLRLHQVELGKFHPLLQGKWELVAKHIWPRDQPREIFEQNLKKCDDFTYGIQLALKEAYGPASSSVKVVTPLAEPR